jgi:hypothetical protein
MIISAAQSSFAIAMDQYVLQSRSDGEKYSSRKSSFKKWNMNSKSFFSFYYVDCI